MRHSLWFLGVSFVGLVGMGVPACSSSSSGSPPANDGHDAAGDDGSAGSNDGSVADQTTQSCKGIAACYSAVVTIPATCGTSFTTVADYSSLPANGGPFTLGGCSGQLSGCNMTFTCPDGESWSVAFSGGGFAATISEQNAGACQATVVGTRLATCPAPGTDSGVPEDSGDAGPAVDAQVDASDASDGGVLAEAGAEGGEVDADLSDAAAEAGAEGSVDAALDASEDVSADAGVDAPDAGDDGPTE